MPDGVLFRTRYETIVEIINPISIPRSGEIIMNAAILITPLVITEPGPELAIAAPTSPPTKVWDELDGNPSHQVTRFHTIAATSAAPITFRFTKSGSTTPFPIVWATLWVKTVKAIKLKNDAIPTAARGESTFVETTVAIEFAESWNPLIKSKTRTSATITYKNVIP